MSPPRARCRRNPPTRWDNVARPLVRAETASRAGCRAAVGGKLVAVPTEPAAAGRDNQPLDCWCCECFYSALGLAD